MQRINVDTANHNIEITNTKDIYTNEDGTANEGITFEELCAFCDSIKGEENEEVVSDYKEPKNEVIDTNKKSLVYVTHNKVNANIVNAANVVIFKLKKMNLRALRNLYKRNNNKEPSAFYDRLMLITNAFRFTQEGIDYDKAANKQTFSVTLSDKVEANKLSWQQVKEIRRLYNIKAYEYIEIKNEENEIIEVKKTITKDSAYSYKELGDMFKLSHIFARNICLNKVYKEKSS